MIIPKESLIEYILNNDSYLEEIVYKKTLEKLKKYEAKIHQLPLSIVDNLFLEHQDSNKSLTAMANRIGIGRLALVKIFNYYHLPIKTSTEGVRENWKDPEFRERHAEATRGELYKRWKNPEFRERHAEATRGELYKRWKNPEFRERHAEATRENWKDKDFRRRNVEATRKNWKDPEFRERQAEAVRQNWKDPEFRRRNAEAVRQNWKNEEFRERQAEATRTARLDPANLSRYKLPTLQGYRKDIGFEAQSAWEANLARVFQYTGREYHPHEKFDLHISEKYKDLFKSDKTSVQIDFVVRDLRERLVLYEIMASPLEDEKSWAKLEMLVEQYNLPLRIITQEKYHRLEKYFKEKIQNSSAFCGWETYQDNILTDPEKYS